MVERGVTKIMKMQFVEYLGGQMFCRKNLIFKRGSNESAYFFDF